MVYAYDQWAQLPVRDLYDSQMMAMAINAAKDMYEKGYQEMKDFKKEYGDFMTPIAADQDWYNQNVTGKVRDAINALYAQGIDPLRNAQGRAMVSQIINNMDYGTIAKKRMRAKNAEEYYKNMATLKMNDKYNEDFSKYLGEDPSQWADDFMGLTSPTQFKDLNAATSPWVDDLEPSDLGLDPTGMYRMTGVTSDQIKGALTPHLSGFVNSGLGRYYYDAARSELIGEGNNNPTDDQIMNRLQDNIITAQHEKTKIKYTEDPYAKMKRDHEYQIAEQNNSAINQMKVHAANAETDYNIETRGLLDIDRDGTVTDEEREFYKQAAMAKMTNAGTKGSKSGDDRYVSYLDDVRESALQTIAGNSANYNIGIKPNLDNMFQSAWINAGLTVNPNKPVWQTRAEISKQLDDMLKSGDSDKYNQVMSKITNYMENKLSVRLEPSAFLSMRAHDNNDPLNQDAIIFDPSVDLNKIVGSNDAILDGYGSIIGRTDKDGVKVGQRRSDAKRYRKQIMLNLNQENSEINHYMFRSIGKLIPMFNNEDGKMHFYAKVKVYGVDDNGSELKHTSFTTLYDWDSLESGRNSTSPAKPMNNLDYGNKNVTSAMTESMAINNMLGAKKSEYKSDDPQLQ